MDPRLPLRALLLLLGCCSRSVARPRGRILGGIQVEQYLRNYMASVQVNETHQCGGLLIDPQWVLTAAHCQPDDDYSRLRVLLGALSLTENEPEKQYFQILRQIAHPNYTATNNHNDIMLLQNDKVDWMIGRENKLNGTAILNRAVKPFPFQREDVDVAPGTACRVAGWGQISLTGKRPDKMNEVEVPVIDRETCNKRDQYDNEITMNMLCAGVRRKDSCEGDSGGPLICNEMAVGIVSYGNRKCGNMKRPGIYTRISPYAAWIDSVLEKFSEKEEAAVDPDNIVPPPVQ